jgi:oxaloacetate decarboxylase alpha subunit
MTYMMAIEAGADILDTALSPLAQGTSQPATEAVVAALMGTPHDTGLDLTLLAEIAVLLRRAAEVREFGEPGEQSDQSDALVSQIPGHAVQPGQPAPRRQG